MVVSLYGTKATKWEVCCKMHESLPAKLRVLRAREGLYLTDAAKKIGIGRDTLAALERGERRPAVPTLRKIADAYGVPVDELLEEELVGGPKADASEAEAPRVTVEELRSLGIPANPSEVIVLNQLLHYRANPPGQIHAVGHVKKEGEPVDVAEVQGIKMYKYLLATDQLTDEEIAVASAALFREFVGASI